MYTAQSSILSHSIQTNKTLKKHHFETVEAGFSASSGSEKAPAFSSIFFNSPDSKSSVTTSQPPTNSPLMNNCGYVFQSLE